MIDLLRDDQALEVLSNATGISSSLARERLGSMVRAFGPGAAIVHISPEELARELGEVG